MVVGEGVGGEGRGGGGEEPAGDAGGGGARHRLVLHVPAPPWVRLCNKCSILKTFSEFLLR